MTTCPICEGTKILPLGTEPDLHDCKYCGGTGKVCKSRAPALEAFKQSLGTKPGGY